MRANPSKLKRPKVAEAREIRSEDTAVTMHQVRGLSMEERHCSIELHPFVEAGDQDPLRFWSMPKNIDVATLRRSVLVWDKATISFDSVVGSKQEPWLPVLQELLAANAIERVDESIEQESFAVPLAADHKGYLPFLDEMESLGIVRNLTPDQAVSTWIVTHQGLGQVSVVQQLSQPRHALVHRSAVRTSKHGARLTTWELMECLDASGWRIQVLPPPCEHENHNHF